MAKYKIDIKYAEAKMKNRQRLTDITALKLSENIRGLYLVMVQM